MTIDLTNDDVDFETAVGDPAAYYADPNAILADTSLSRTQKQRFLAEWAQDLASRQTADGEGMAPDEAPFAHDTSAHEAAMLKSVNSALEQIETAPDSAPDAAVRSFWTRLKKVIG